MKYIKVQTQNEIICLKLENVVEVGHIKDITEYSEENTSLRGVANLRNQIVPILELITLLKKKGKPYLSYGKIVFIRPLKHRDILDPLIGLLVDKVGQLDVVEESEIIFAPRNRQSHPMPMVLFKKQEKVMSLINIEDILVTEMKKIERKYNVK